MAFELRNVPLLARVGADRADQLRTDVDAALAGWPDAAVLRVDSRSQVLISERRRRYSATRAASATKPPQDAVFLGRLPDGRHVWGIRAALVAPDDEDAEVLDLRSAGQVFDDASAQLVATATALLNWHDRARFSPVDGAPTKSVKAGWSRVDPVSGHEEFPRIDPAVICLVHDGGDRAVLARQTVWPAAAVLTAGRIRRGRRVVRVVRGSRDRRGDRPARARRALPRQPAVAVPAVADGGFPRDRRPRRRVLVQRRRDRRGSMVHPRRDSRGVGTGRLEQRIAVAACCCPDRSRSPARSSNPGRTP